MTSKEEASADQLCGSYPEWESVRRMINTPFSSNVIKYEWERPNEGLLQSHLRKLTVMATQLQACIRCAKAKRRCGKQTPSCLRCRERAVECSYPPLKPFAFVLCKEDTIESGTVTSTNSLAAKASNVHISERPGVDGNGPIGLDPWSGHIDHRQAPAWFTSPDTWEVDHFVPLERPPPAAIDLKCVRAKIDLWLTEWVTNGSNPFIHPQLYRLRLPETIQDAYTTLSCYLGRTTANEEIVFRIIEDRSKRFIEEHTAGLNKMSNRRNVDPLEHLAKVQALIIYQNICLFNGDIRLRHLAENRISTMYDWMNQMVMHARQALCLGSYVVSAGHKETVVGTNLMNSENWEDILWYSWILAESVRRTWLVASGVQGVYLNLQQPGGAPCKGSMKFTARQGVWEAESAVEWEKLCISINVGLIHVGEAETLSTRVALEDISEFAVMVLQSTWGSEKMRRWGIKIQKPLN